MVVWAFSLEPVSTGMKAVVEETAHPMASRKQNEEKGQDLRTSPPRHRPSPSSRLHSLKAPSPLSSANRLRIKPAVHGSDGGRKACSWVPLYQSLWRAPCWAEGVFTCSVSSPSRPPHFPLWVPDSLAIKSVVFEGRQSHVGSPRREPGDQRRNKTRT